MPANTDNPDLEIFLPVYNEGESIEATIREIYDELSRELRVRFIICEDGSRDDTKAILRFLAKELPLRLNLSDARRGYSRAVRDGMKMLESEYLLCLDSDGQCDPRDFRRLWEGRKSADVSIGWRVKRRDTLTRKIFSRFFYVIYQSVFHVPVHDPSCPYVLVSKTVLANPTAHADRTRVQHVSLKITEQRNCGRQIFGGLSGSAEDGVFSCGGAGAALMLRTSGPGAVHAAHGRTQQHPG